jgi:hypothetical protein
MAPWVQYGANCSQSIPSYLKAKKWAVSVVSFMLIMMNLLLQIVDCSSWHRPSFAWHWAFLWHDSSVRSEPTRAHQHPTYVVSTKAPWSLEIWPRRWGNNWVWASQKREENSLRVVPWCSTHFLRTKDVQAKTDSHSIFTTRWNKRRAYHEESMVFIGELESRFACPATRSLVSTISS